MNKGTAKKRLYKTARIKGLNCCYVAILDYNEKHDTFLCETPFKTRRVFKANTLDRFCL